MTDLSAVVINYGRERLLDACLASLAQSLAAWQGASETIVVDNGSPDGSCAMVRSRYPSVRLLALPDNRGFGAAANAAAGAAGGEWMLLLNNDVTVEREAIAELMAVAASAADEVGSIAAQMRFADGSERINSAGIEVDRLGVAHDRLLGAPVRAGEREAVEVFGVSAGAALYRRSMLSEVGGFDEDFFVFLEDVDLAWRARMRGWRALYAPAAVVHHVHSATSVHNSAFKHLHVGRNRMLLLAKNADSGHLRRHGAAMVAYDLAYVAYAVIADRTLAPVRGRLQGLRRWRTVRTASAGARRPVALGPIQGLRGALRRRRAWGGDHA